MPIIGNSRCALGCLVRSSRAGCGCRHERSWRCSTCLASPVNFRSTRYRCIFLTIGRPFPLNNSRAWTGCWQRWRFSLTPRRYWPRPKRRWERTSSRRYLKQGLLTKVSSDVFFLTATYQQMVDLVVAHLRANGTVTVAEVRDMFKASRKYAQALMEHLDDRRITRRVGDERILRVPVSSAPGPDR